MASVFDHPLWSMSQAARRENNLSFTEDFSLPNFEVAYPPHKWWLDPTYDVLLRRGQRSIGKVRRLRSTDHLERPVEIEETVELVELPEWVRRVCSCNKCGRLFVGVGAFDYHRSGQYDRPGTIRTSTRRCLTADEMRQRGMWLNDFGRWARQREADPELAP